MLLITGKGAETRQKRGTQYIDTPSDVEYVHTYLQEYDVAHGLDGMEKVRSLLSLLPILKRHEGKTVVVKYGGSAIDAAAQADTVLQDAAAREDADETVKNQVNETIQTMADYTVTEAQIENLVTAKGYADCVAFLGENALSLAVSAPLGGLTETDTAKIVDLVNQATGFSPDQVKIIEVEPETQAGAE